MGGARQPINTSPEGMPPPPMTPRVPPATNVTNDAMGKTPEGPGEPLVPTGFLENVWKTIRAFISKVVSMISLNPFQCGTGLKDSVSVIGYAVRFTFGGIITLFKTLWNGTFGLFLFTFKTSTSAAV